MLDVKDLHVKFKDSSREAVGGIDLAMAPGERLGLVGESGSGKTVTAMAITGLIQRHRVDIRGQVIFDGKDLMTASREEHRRVQGPGMGVVFQEPMTSLNPLMKVGKQVEEVLQIHTDLPATERKKLALEAMERVGLPEPLRTYEKYPHQLSGGQRQRAIIAAASLIRPKLLICDEPTTALDVTVQAQILALLKELSQEAGMGILLISHDLSVVRKLCDRVAVMKRGLIVEQGDVEQIFRDPQHEYTRQLIAATATRRRRYE